MVRVDIVRSSDGLSVATAKPGNSGGHICVIKDIIQLQRQSYSGYPSDGQSRYRPRRVIVTMNLDRRKHCNISLISAYVGRESSCVV
jgi:hypothetical protein